jgi:hypothetical protein
VCLLEGTTPKRALIQQQFKVLTMNNSQPTKSTNETRNRKKHISQQKQQKFLQRIIAISFVLQAALIAVNGNLDVLSGKPVLNVLQGMITQGIELIIKAQGVQKRLKKSDRKPRSDQ